MPVQSPALSLDDWNKRYYDVGLGTLYPINFMFRWQLATKGIPGDGGTFYYVTASYSAANFMGIATINSILEPTSNFSTAIQISFLSTPSFSDGGSLSPVDGGNIIYQRCVPTTHVQNEKVRGQNLYPGIIPLSFGQTLYIHYCALVGTLSSVLIEGSVTLHTLQTGLKI